MPSVVSAVYSFTGCQDCNLGSREGKGDIPVSGYIGQLFMLLADTTLADQPSMSAKWLAMGGQVVLGGSYRTHRPRPRPFKVCHSRFLQLISFWFPTSPTYFSLLKWVIKRPWLNLVQLLCSCAVLQLFHPFFFLHGYCISSWAMPFFAKQGAISLHQEPHPTAALLLLFKLGAAKPAGQPRRPLILRFTARLRSRILSPEEQHLSWSFADGRV